MSTKEDILEEVARYVRNAVVCLESLFAKGNIVQCDERRPRVCGRERRQDHRRIYVDTVRRSCGIWGWLPSRVWRLVVQDRRYSRWILGRINQRRRTIHQ